MCDCGTCIYNSPEYEGECEMCEDSSGYVEDVTRLED